nr:prepilin-type N-terminal cleavage/methylation domain-containing protein [Providencia rustigianii]
MMEIITGNKYRHISHEQGFTLVEILVVLFICSLVVLPALSHWQQQLQRLRLIDAARQTVEFIYSSLMEGIYLNQQRILVINSETKHWRLQIKNAETEQNISQFSGDRFPDIKLKKSSRQSVNLYGRQGTSRAFRIELGNQTEHITVFMSAAGRVRSCSYQKIAGVPPCWSQCDIVKKNWVFHY